MYTRPRTLRGTPLRWADESAPKVDTNGACKSGGLFVELLEAIASVEVWRPSHANCECDAFLLEPEAGRLDLMPDVAY